jgi:3-dehydroquinate dehydratase-2
LLFSDAAITTSLPNFLENVEKRRQTLAKSLYNALFGHFAMATILVLHGPNLNMLGSREPEIYGSETLNDINQRLQSIASESGHHLQTLQSNAEYELIDRIHDARLEEVDFILINPAAFTHTSVALRDALLAVEIPFIEVHLSNVHAREKFRHHSYFSDVAVGVICGLGSQGYDLALQAALKSININDKNTPAIDSTSTTDEQRA